MVNRTWYVCETWPFMENGKSLWTGLSPGEIRQSFYAQDSSSYYYYYLYIKGTRRKTILGPSPITPLYPFLLSFSLRQDSRQSRPSITFHRMKQKKKKCHNF